MHWYWGFLNSSVVFILCREEAPKGLSTGVYAASYDPEREGDMMAYIYAVGALMFTILLSIAVGETIYRFIKWVTK